jgi:hypothetical protein
MWKPVNLFEENRDTLIRYRWLTQYHDGKNTLYACTNYGMDVLLSWMKITDQIKTMEFVADPPTLTTDKYKKIIEELSTKGLITAYFKTKDEPMKIAPTPQGQELFESFLFWQDSDAQNKLARNKKIKKFGVDFMKGLVKTTLELQKFSQQMNGTKPAKKKRRAK